MPTGRLVVLGEPGAGKTMLMVRLVLDLLASRASGGPVPVLVSLASWNPADQGLHAWLTTQLITDFPALAAAAPGSGERTRIDALLRAKLILPVLDGLDEIPEQVRGSAITRINDALRPGEQLIVTCRSGQFQDAVRPPGGAVITVRAAAVVQLCPLAAEAVSRYLRDAAGDPGAVARWDPVLALLGTEAPVGQALVTPLMVSLAQEIYHPRSGERAAQLRDPAELCGMGDRAAVGAHLLDAFIPAAYRGRPGRWGAQQAERWLAFLAGHLQNTIKNPDLAWWQLARAAPPDDFLVFTMALVGTAGLVAGLVIGVGDGVGAGVLVVIAGSLFAGAAGKRQKPSRGVRIRALGVVLGLVLGLIFGLAFALGPEPGAGIEAGLLAGLGGFVVGVGMGGLSSVPDDLAEAASPGRVLTRDRWAALVLAGMAAVPVAVLLGLISGRTAGLVYGLTAGLALGLAGSARQTAWPSYALTRGWLAWHQQLPWSLMGFLADAHDRGVLRQVGSVYQFRHIDLQRRLVSRQDQ